MNLADLITIFVLTLCGLFNLSWCQSIFTEVSTLGLSGTGSSNSITVTFSQDCWYPTITYFAYSVSAYSYSTETWTLYYSDSTNTGTQSYIGILDSTTSSCTGNSGKCTWTNVNLLTDEDITSILNTNAIASGSLEIYVSSATNWINYDWYGYATITCYDSSNAPTGSPTTSSPTKLPTPMPSTVPAPTKTPSKNPSLHPTTIPTKQPTSPPSDITSQPSNVPSKSPFPMPTIEPTTKQPTKSPLDVDELSDPPTMSPTGTPTVSTNTPTKIPTDTPTNIPTNIPTNTPTTDPTSITISPTSITISPTSITTSPTNNPIGSNNNVPTTLPTDPTIKPTQYPTPPRPTEYVNEATDSIMNVVNNENDDGTSDTNTISTTTGTTNKSVALTVIYILLVVILLLIIGGVIFCWKYQRDQTKLLQNIRNSAKMSANRQFLVNSNSNSNINDKEKFGKINKNKRFKGNVAGLMARNHQIIKLKPASSEDNSSIPRVHVGSIDDINDNNNRPHSPIAQADRTSQELLKGLPNNNNKPNPNRLSVYDVVHNNAQLQQHYGIGNHAQQGRLSVIGDDEQPQAYSANFRFSFDGNSINYDKNNISNKANLNKFKQLNIDNKINGNNNENNYYEGFVAYDGKAEDQAQTDAMQTDFIDQIEVAKKMNDIDNNINNNIDIPVVAQNFDGPLDLDDVHATPGNENASEMENGAIGDIDDVGDVGDVAVVSGMNNYDNIDAENNLLDDIELENQNMKISEIISSNETSDFENDNDIDIFNEDDEKAEIDDDPELLFGKVTPMGD